MELSLALFLSLSVDLPLPTVSRENAAVRVAGLCRFVSVFDRCLVTSSDAVDVTVVLASGLFGLALWRETGKELAWREREIEGEAILE